jgi:hypothetical protein
MRSLSKRKVVLTLGVCVLVSSVFAIVTAAAQQEPAPKKQEPSPKKQEPAPKKTASKPKVARRKVNIPESQLILLNAKSFASKKEIAHKEITLADYQRLSGHRDAKLDSIVKWPTQGGKTVTATVEQALKVANAIDAWTCKHGGATLLNDLADYPKDGVAYGLKTNATPARLAKQKKALADAHAKASAEKLAKAIDVRKISSANAADSKKRQDKLTNSFQDQLDGLLKKVDTKTATKAQNQLITLLKKPNSLKDKATMKAVAKLAPRARKGVAPNSIIGHILTISQADYHKTKSFSVGDAEIAEADFVADLEITASVNPFIGVEELSARASLNGNLFILDGSKSSPDNLVDVLAKFDTGGASGDVFQAHAKLLGSDIFTPINKDIPTDGQKHDDPKDFPFDVNVVQGNIGVFGIGINYGLDLKGDFNVDIMELATPTEITVVPTISLNANVAANASVDALFVEVGVTGTFNLVNEKLTIVGAELINSSDKVAPFTPFLDILGSADNTLSALGGNITFVVDFINPLTGNKHQLGSITLLSVPDQVTASGFLFGPDETKVPIGIPTPSPVNADVKKKKK